MRKQLTKAQRSTLALLSHYSNFTHVTGLATLLALKCKGCIEMRRNGVLWESRITETGLREVGRHASL